MGGSDEGRSDAVALGVEVSLDAPAQPDTTNVAALSRQAAAMLARA